jgi:cytochrome c peroxidase
VIGSAAPRARRRRAVRIASKAVMALLCGAFAVPAVSASAALLPFDADERRAIARHGPWPPPVALDAGNAAAGDAQAIALGQRLFFDARLSDGGALSCASCHRPQWAWADRLARGKGRVALERNTPSLWNTAHERWFGWDGAADCVWSQAIRPILDPRDMGASAAHVRARLEREPELACRYRAAFGRAPSDDDDEAALVRAAKAIGAFVGTLRSGRTRYADFRAALERGDSAAAARYPLAAQRGLKLFVGRGRCNLCHLGPMFSNGEFADTGVPFFVRPGVVDPGRHGGIQALRASRYNLLSRFSDARDEAASTKTRHVEQQHRHFGEFKVPSLRNVALTAPYMHDGQLATLADVVHHYSELNLERLHADGEQILQPLHLNARERADLLAFLRTLSDPRAKSWRPAPLPVCRSEPPR